MDKKYVMLVVVAGLVWLALPDVSLAAEEAAQGGYLSGYDTQIPQPAAMSWWSTAAYLVSLFVVFAFVVGMAYLAARFLGGHFAKPMQGRGGRVLSHLPLGPNRSVCVVEVAGRFLLLGVTEHEVSLLAEITDPEEIGRLQQQAVSAPLDMSMFSQQFGSLASFAQKIPPMFRK